MPWGPTSAELIQERDDALVEAVTTNCGDAISDHDWTLTSYSGSHIVYLGNDTPMVAEYVRVHNYTAECNWCAIRYNKEQGFHGDS